MVSHGHVTVNGRKVNVPSFSLKVNDAVVVKSQTTSSAETDCLIGGHNPSFAPCSKILNQADTVGIGTTNPLFKLDVQDLQDATGCRSNL